MPEGTCIHVYPLDVKFTTNYVRCRVIKYPLDLSYMYVLVHIMVHVHVYTCMYIQHVHSTLAFRKQKEKKGKVTYPTIAQTNKHTCTCI